MSAKNSFSSKYLIPFAALIIAFAAFVVSIYVARVTSDTAKKQLRAYVVIEPAALLNFEVGNKVEGHVWIGNAGQTPARRTERYMGVRILPHPLGKRIDFQTPATREVGKLTVSPGQMKDYVRRESATPLTGDTLKAVLEGKMRIYVFGRAT